MDCEVTKRGRGRTWLLAGLTLAGLVFVAAAAGSARAAAAITVTTTADAFGGDGAHCSLREAIQAISLTAAFGGCPAGAPGDTIVLPAGQYLLTVAGSSEDQNATGDLDLWRPLTLLASGGRATVSAAGLGDRVLDVHAGVVNLVDLTLTGGDVTGATDKTGGGIRNTGVLTLTRVDVNANTAYVGGGLYNVAGAVSLTLVDSSVAGNTALNQSGGLQNEAQLVILRSSLISNTAGNLAGGLYNETSGVAVLRNVTVSGNTVTVGAGAGLYNVNLAPGLTLNNVTVTNNTANANAGGLYNAGKTNLANTILAGNSAVTSADCDTLSGTLDSKGYNVLGQTVAAACNLTGDAATVISTTTPLLGALAQNGGRTLTHAVQVGSPALDHGNPAPPAGGYTCETADQRGLTRTGLCDVGAFETSVLRQLYLMLIARN